MLKKTVPFSRPPRTWKTVFRLRLRERIEDRALHKSRQKQRNNTICEPTHLRDRFYSEMCLKIWSIFVKISPAHRLPGPVSPNHSVCKLSLSHQKSNHAKECFPSSDSWAAKVPKRSAKVPKWRHRASHTTGLDNSSELKAAGTEGVALDIIRNKRKHIMFTLAARAREHDFADLLFWFQHAFLLAGVAGWLVSWLAGWLAGWLVASKICATEH